MNPTRDETSPLWRSILDSEYSAGPHPASEFESAFHVHLHCICITISSEFAFHFAFRDDYILPILKRKLNHTESVLG